MYIFHPKNEFDIAGQDLGDDQGDTVFVCLDALTNFSSFTDHSYAWLTKWEIEIVPTAPVVTKPMYIFHPKNEFDIAGQDLGDDKGDTVFVCLDALTNFSSFTDHSYAWLTKWEIEMVPQYGQYQNCNGYNP